MRKILLASVAIIGFGAIVPAQAADLAARPYTKAPAYEPAPIYNWTGFYIGGHVGGAFGGDNNFYSPGFTYNGSNDGVFMGGVQAGYDTQFSANWVFGLEANYSFLDTGSWFANRGLGSVTGRLGYTWGPALLYAKGGYAFRDSKLGVTDAAGVPLAFATTGNRDNGYTVGAGLEYMFAPNWSAKVEYQYYNFGKTTFAAGSPPDVVGANFRNDEHTVKAGVNYRFGWGGPTASHY